MDTTGLSSQDPQLLKRSLDTLILIHHDNNQKSSALETTIKNIYSQIKDFKLYSNKNKSRMSFGIVLMFDGIDSLDRSVCDMLKSKGYFDFESINEYLDNNETMSLNLQMYLKRKLMFKKHLLAQARQYKKKRTGIIKTLTRTATQLNIGGRQDEVEEYDIDETAEMLADCFKWDIKMDTHGDQEGVAIKAMGYDMLIKNGHTPSDTRNYLHIQEIQRKIKPKPKIDHSTTKGEDANVEVSTNQPNSSRLFSPKFSVQPSNQGGRIKLTPLEDPPHERTDNQLLSVGEEKVGKTGLDITVNSSQDDGLPSSDKRLDSQTYDITLDELTASREIPDDTFLYICVKQFSQGYNDSLRYIFSYFIPQLKCEYFLQTESGCWANDQGFNYLYDKLTESRLNGGVGGQLTCQSVDVESTVEKEYELKTGKKYDQLSKCDRMWEETKYFGNIVLQFLVRNTQLADHKHLYSVDKMFECNFDILKSIPKEFSLYRTEALIGPPPDINTLVNVGPNWVQKLYLDIEKVYYNKPKQGEPTQFNYLGLKWVYQGMKDIYNIQMQLSCDKVLGAHVILNPYQEYRLQLQPSTQVLVQYDQDTSVYVDNKVVSITSNIGSTMFWLCKCKRIKNSQLGYTKKITLWASNVLQLYKQFLSFIMVASLYTLFYVSFSYSYESLIEDVDNSKISSWPNQTANLFLYSIVLMVFMSLTLNKTQIVNWMFSLSLLISLSSLCFLFSLISYIYRRATNYSVDGTNVTMLITSAVFITIPLAVNMINIIIRRPQDLFHFLIGGAIALWCPVLFYMSIPIYAYCKLDHFDIPLKIKSDASQFKSILTRNVFIFLALWIISNFITYKVIQEYVIPSEVDKKSDLFHSGQERFIIGMVLCYTVVPFIQSIFALCEIYKSGFRAKPSVEKSKVEVRYQNHCSRRVMSWMKLNCFRSYIGLQCVRVIFFPLYLVLLLVTLIIKVLWYAISFPISLLCCRRSKQYHFNMDDDKISELQIKVKDRHNYDIQKKWEQTLVDNTFGFDVLLMKQHYNTQYQLLLTGTEGTKKSRHTQLTTANEQQFIRENRQEVNVDMDSVRDRQEEEEKKGFEDSDGSERSESSFSRASESYGSQARIDVDERKDVDEHTSESQESTEVDGQIESGLVKKSKSLVKKNVSEIQEDSQESDSDDLERQRQDQLQDAQDKTQSNFGD